MSIVWFDGRLIFVNVSRKGSSSPGTIIDPSKYHNFTTDGSFQARIRAIAAMTASPYWVNRVGLD